MVDGIITRINGDDVPGDIFDKASAAIITIRSETNLYFFKFCDLCRLTYNKTGKKKGDSKQEPKEVLLYMISQISKILFRAVYNSKLDSKIRQSICSNTASISPKKPYDTSNISNFRRFGVALMAHPIGKEFVKEYVPPAFAEAGEKMLVGLDLSPLLD